MDFPIFVDNILKIKESEGINKSLDLTGELRKLWYMKTTVMLIIAGTLSTATKILKMSLRELKIVGQFQLQICWDQQEYWEESWKLLLWIKWKAIS